MIVIETKPELLKQRKKANTDFPKKKVGLVPTMGFLHDGHVALIREAKRECSLVIVSIFVNPLQFNEASDFENYPVNTKNDIDICKKEGVDIIFSPNPKEMYAQTPLLEMGMPMLTNNLCGKHRPGHFEGVLMVVSRLLQLCQPDIAFFGKKDYQQFLIIKQLATDLDFTTRIVGVDTCRNQNGLALSSRNAHLTPRGLEHASLISRALTIGKNEFLDGTISPKELVEVMTDIIESGTLNKIDYLDIVDLEKLQILNSLNVNSNFLIAIAVFVEGVRLIDNIEVNI